MNVTCVRAHTRVLISLMSRDDPLLSRADTSILEAALISRKSLGVWRPTFHSQLHLLWARNLRKVAHSLTFLFLYVNLQSFSKVI